MKDLSSKQDQILEFLRSFIEDKDYPPSIRDIQEGCGISSTSVVDYNLRKLEEKGYIRRDREVSRGIEILVRLFVGSQFLTEIMLCNPGYLDRLTQHKRLAELKSVQQLYIEAQGTQIGLKDSPPRSR